MAEQSTFARRMMAQKLMTEKRDDPFSDSRFFAGKMRPSMDDIENPTRLSDMAGPAYGAAATGSLFAPGAGIADVMGYAPNPMQQGEMLPSFGENIGQGKYLDAGLQTLGVAGDVLQAGGVVFPPAAAVGTMLKAPRAARVASSSLPALSPAIRSEGKILKGGVGETHLDVLTGIQDKNLARRLISDGENRGFVTEKGKYLSRDRAVDYALQNDLIDPRFSSFYSPDRYGELVADHLRKPVPIDPNEAAGAAMDAAQARYFETGKFEPPTADNPVSIVPPTETEPGIIAFHGSGADFDEFRLEMIGTGEGAQAYGYGLYFTDSKDIAKFYKETVGQERNQIQFKGKPLDSVYTADILENFGDDIENIVKQAQEFGIQGDQDEIRNMVETVFSQVSQGLSSKDDALKAIESLGRTRDGSPTESMKIYKEFVEPLVETPNIPEGKIYKVGLAPKPDELLDYDLPLSQQPKMLELIDDVHGDPEIIIQQAGLDPATATGGDFVKALGGIGQEQGAKAASEFLAKAGIPGIKFFSGNTRNTAGGKLIDVAEATDGFRAKVAVDNRAGGLGGSGRVVTTSQPYKTKQQALDWADEAIKNKESNYVIFDDKAVKILEKYGIVGPVAVTAAGAAAVNRGRNDNDNGGSILPDAGVL